MAEPSEPSEPSPLLSLGLGPAQEARASVLVVGDGDLSYGATLCEHWRNAPDVKVMATVLEPTAEALVQQYPSAAESMRRIEAVANDSADAETGLLAKAYELGVDATALLSPSGQTCVEAGMPYDSIVFNFPQTPPAEKKHRKIQFQRQLLSGESLTNTPTLQHSNTPTLLTTHPSAQPQTFCPGHRRPRCWRRAG